MPRLVVDTGFLVALYLRGDGLHQAAIGFLKNNRAPLVTAAPVIVEASYFLSPAATLELLKWVARGDLEVLEIGVSTYAEISRHIEKYAEQDIDFTDAALI